MSAFKKLCTASIIALAALTTSTAMAQDVERTLAFGETDVIESGLLFDLLNILDGNQHVVGVAPSENGTYGSSVAIGDSLFCEVDGNDLVVRAAEGGPAATGSCWLKVCSTVLVTLCSEREIALTSVPCRDEDSGIDPGCNGDAPACDTSGATPQCVGCTDDADCSATEFGLGLGESVIVPAGDILYDLLSIDLLANLTTIQVSNAVNAPFSDEAVLTSGATCGINADGNVEIVASETTEGNSTCYVQLCVDLVDECLVVPLDVLVDGCFVTGTCNLASTCNAATSTCSQCNDTGAPGEIDAGCSTRTPICAADGTDGETCVECTDDADCATNALDVLLAPLNDALVGKDELLRFLNLNTNLVPSSLAVGGSLNGPFDDEVLLGTDTQIANCALDPSGNVVLLSAGAEGDVTCFVQVCVEALGATITSCLVVPVDVKVDACVLDNSCNLVEVCQANNTCGGCADTKPSGQVDAGCDNDTPACSDSACVECTENPDCAPKHPLLDLDLGQVGEVTKAALLTTLNLAADVIIQNLQVSATALEGFGDSAALDVDGNVSQCRINADGNVEVLANAVAYADATCYVQVCTNVLDNTVHGCFVVPIEINIDPCAKTGTCRPPVCDPDSNRCVECIKDSDCDEGEVCNLTTNTCGPPDCEDDSSGGVDTGCNEENPACKETPSTTDSDTCVECTEDVDCDGNEVCDLETNTCEPACTNPPCSPECTDTAPGAGVDDGCDATEPICDVPGTDPDRCVVCVDDAEGNATDTGCTTATPICDRDGATDNGRCVECETDADCDEDEVCDLTTNTCEPKNDPPLGIDDIVTTPEDNAVLINILANDIEPDGDALTLESIAVNPSHGTVETFDDGSVLYTPDHDFVGIDVFDYTACDPQGACDNGHVIVTVTPINDPPIANDDNVDSAPNAELTIDVLANDFDADRDVLSIGSVNGGGAGAVAGKVVVTAPAAGEVSFTYTACDPDGACDEATVTVRVRDVDPTVANDDEAETDSGVSVDIDVLANDHGSDGAALTIAGFSNAQHGTVTMTADGMRYRSDDGYVGDDSFVYTACTATNVCDNATVHVTVNDGANHAPVAIDDLVQTTVDTAVTFDATENDFDIDGDTLTVIAVAAPQHGTAATDDNGHIVYTPTAGFIGIDRFEVTITDPDGLTDTSVATILVTETENTPPVANDDAYTVAGESTFGMGVLANDSDADGDGLVIVAVVQPSHGAATFGAGAQSIIYVPDAGYRGPDSFTYRISDGRGGFDDAVVTIDVVEPGQPPVAADDTVVTDEDTAVAIAVLANDTDPDGMDTVSITDNTEADHGTVVRGNDGRFTYTPNANYNGPDEFSYEICDELDNCATADVRITVRPVNDAPDAIDDEATVEAGESVTVDVLANDIDVDGDTLVIARVVNGPVQATIVGGKILFAATAVSSGSVFVTYEACDPSALCDQAVLTITIADGPNVGPNANDDSAQTPKDTPVDIDVLANDTDTDGDPLNIQNNMTRPHAGEVTRLDGKVHFVPITGFVGRTTFQYTACDPRQLCDTATVTVQVGTLPDNHDPIAVDDEAETPVDTAVTVDVLANDSDPDGDLLTIKSATDGDEGDVTIVDGQIVYTPNIGFEGIDTFEYSACDSFDVCDSATVMVTVGTPGPEQRFIATGGLGNCSAGGTETLGYLLATAMVMFLVARRRRVV